MTDGETCPLCRVTYSVFENFPDLPDGMVLNAETGCFLPLATLRSYQSGYEMAEALGTAWACRCIERKGRAASRWWSKSFTYDQQYILKDGDGQPLANVSYRIVVDGERVITGTTNASGQTARVITRSASNLKLQLAK